MSKASPNSYVPPYVVRVALAYGNTILSEKTVPSRGKITIGQREGCTFVLPGRAREQKRGRQVLFNRRGLHLLEGLVGRLHLQGEPTDVKALRAAGTSTLELQPEDWGVLHLEDEPRVRLVIQRVQAEALPPMSRTTDERPWLISTGVSAIAFALLLIVAFLQYDPDRPVVEGPELSDRMLEAMFNKPPEPPPEEEPEISNEDQEEEKERKKAGGDEGKFGDPNKRGPSNVPRNPEEVAANSGLVKELNTLADSSAMNDLLGVSGQVGQALGGLDEGPLVVGGGNFGMSTKGSGRGGGGEGEGTIYGTGDVDVGGAGSSNRKKTVKGNKRPGEKKVAVRTGTPTVKGQLSKELIDREVRRHRAQITFCYNKQLLRYPHLSGKVMLSWVIAMDGSVRSAKVRSSSLGNKDAESCMVRALESWKFPKPEGGVVQVLYPFIFGTK